MPRADRAQAGLQRGPRTAHVARLRFRQPDRVSSMWQRVPSPHAGSLSARLMCTSNQLQQLDVSCLRQLKGFVHLRRGLRPAAYTPASQAVVQRQPAARLDLVRLVQLGRVRSWLVDGYTRPTHAPSRLSCDNNRLRTLNVAGLTNLMQCVVQYGSVRGPLTCRPAG